MLSSQGSETPGWDGLSLLIPPSHTTHQMYRKFIKGKYSLLEVSYLQVRDEEGGLRPRLSCQDGLELLLELLQLSNPVVFLHTGFNGVDELPLQRLALHDELIRSWIAALKAPPPMIGTFHIS